MMTLLGELDLYKLPNKLNWGCLCYKSSLKTDKDRTIQNA